LKQDIKLNVVSYFLMYAMCFYVCFTLLFLSTNYIYYNKFKFAIDACIRLIFLKKRKVKK